MKTPKAFTLIELLIVVAIIAILAAIAVPNFLEAQTRSKISRNLADMRTIATCLETYVVDNNKYPPSDSWGLSEEGLQRLTTPITYCTSSPDDVFRKKGFLYGQQSNPPSNNFPNTFSPNPVQIRDTILNDRGYGYQSLEPSNRTTFTSDYARFKLVVGTNQFAPATFRYPSEIGFQLRSVGPDQADSQVLPYDATNGTISNGDIMRWGPTNETLSK